jgi:hypothetical protein
VSNKKIKKIVGVRYILLFYLFDLVITDFIFLFWQMLGVRAKGLLGIWHIFLFFIQQILCFGRGWVAGKDF